MNDRNSRSRREDWHGYLQILLVVGVAALGVKTSLKGLVTVGAAPIVAMLAQTLIVAVYAFAALVLLA